MSSHGASVVCAQANRERDHWGAQWRTSTTSELVSKLPYEICGRRSSLSPGPVIATPSRGNEVSALATPITRRYPSSINACRQYQIG